MIETATGLVLRTRPLTETSLIVQWLTPGVGRVATVAKGAHRPKSPFRGKLDLFYLADFSFTRSRRSDLHTLAEVSLVDPHPALRRDLAALQQAAYAATLIEQTTEPDTPLPEIFELMRSFVIALCAEPPRPRLAMAFELKLLGVLGLEPRWEESSLTPAARTLAEALVRENWARIALLTATPAEVLAVRRFLHGFLIFHLGRLPEGRAVVMAGATPRAREGEKCPGGSAPPGSLEA